MAVTRLDRVGDGSTTIYDVSFSLGYLKREYVYVYLEGVEYTTQLDYAWLNNTQIELNSPVEVGVKFSIRRVVPRNTPVNDYEAGAILRESNLDDSFVQSLMILEEIEDGYISVAGDFLVGSDIDMQGYKVTQSGPASDYSDLVTLGQMTAVIEQNTLTGAANGSTPMHSVASLEAWTKTLLSLAGIPDPGVADVEGTSKRMDALQRVLLAQVASIKDLQARTGVADQQVVVANYHETTEGGGGIFVWGTGKHDGGTFIDPTRQFPTNWTDQLQLNTWFTVGSTTVGWRRQDSSCVHVSGFGAKGDGVTLDTAAVKAAIMSDWCRVLLHSGTYWLESLDLNNVTDTVVEGDSSGSVKIRWESRGPIIKSPNNLRFKNMTFSPVPSDTLYLEITASNYTSLEFDTCAFEGFGGATGNKAGSSCVVMYAGDSNSALFAAGSSKGGRFTNCVFEAAERKTNFGVRIYTEFVATQAAKNSDNIIHSTTFNGFNWNAVEIAGRNTEFCIVSNCVANECGLTPFDIDKGAHDNLITDVTINRMLGNIDPLVNPNTRISICNIQGVEPSAYYAYNNVVRGIVAHVKAADLLAYGKPAACITIAYAENNIVENVKVFCDSVPVRVADSSFALAIVAIETASGNTVRNIDTTNMSVGIFETANKNPNMTAKEPNIFENMRNTGKLTGEVVAFHRGAATGAFARNIVRGITMETLLSDSSITLGTPKYALYIKSEGSASHFFKIEKSNITIPASANAWFAYNAINNMSISDVDVNENGAPLLESRFVASLGSTTPFIFGISNVNSNFGRNPMNMLAALASLNPVCNIVGSLTDNGYGKSGGSTLYASAPPTYPAATYFDKNLVVNKIDKTSSGNEGWIAIAGAWKEFGTIA